MKENKALINIKVGYMIKYYRELNHLTQEELSFEAGLHRTYIGQVERAEKNATIQSIEKIALALKLDITDLFDFSKIENLLK